MTVPISTYDNGFRLIDGGDLNDINSALNGLVNGVILKQPTINSATITGTIAGGTYTGTTLSGPTMNSGTLNAPAITSGYMINPVLLGPPPVATGASYSIVGGATPGYTFLLNNAAGSVVTLPAATGTGSKFKFVVSTTTTSGAHKILCASGSDFINGLAIGQNAGTCKAFSSAAATNHSIQMPFAGTQPSGGFIGDYFEFQDIAANLWQCNGMYQAGTIPTTPFSSATS